MSLSGSALGGLLLEGRLVESSETASQGSRYWTQAGFSYHPCIIVLRCGPIDLVTPYAPQLKWRQIEYGGGTAREDMMSVRSAAANKLAVLLGAFAMIAVGVGITPVSAAAKKQFDSRGRAYYGANGPNVSYQQGPHTRIYVTKRSWLDAGVEVLPGDRKFTDYAFPPAIGYPSFGRENKNRPIDRQPLNPPSDLGGYPQSFPLY